MSYEKCVILEGRLEFLEAQTNKYFAENPDPIFAEYLVGLKERIRSQKTQTELLQEELERNYQMFRRRMELADARPQKTASVVQAPTAVPVQPAPAQPSPVQNVNPRPVYTGNTVAAVQAPARVQEKKKSGGAEFMIGTAILSVVGGAFILTALVMLGMNFMNGFLKGMCLYAGTGLLLAVSELLIHRRWPKLATVFSAIGIGGLYLSTAINYLSLHNFGMASATAITLLSTAFAIFLSKKRDSLVYRILGLIASYLCLMTAGKGISLTEAWVLMGIILLINIMCLAIPLRKYRTAFHVIHLSCNLILAFNIDYHLNKIMMPDVARAILIIGLILIMQLILIIQMRYESSEMALGKKIDSSVVKVVYCFGILGYSGILAGILGGGEDNIAVMRYGCIVAISVICVVSIIALRKYSVKWFPYYLMNLTIFLLGCFSGNTNEVIICLVTLLAVAKVLSLWRIQELKLCDAILTTITCIFLLVSLFDISIYTYVLLVAVVISIFFISRWQAYFQVLLVYTLGFFAVAQLSTLLQLPAFVGLLFVGMLLFNNVSRFRGEYVLVYNVLALVGEIICFLLLALPVYQNAYITYLCMLVFGVATIVLTFQEKYHMDFKGKNFILALFLTYMALIVKTNLPIINSILLMVIALVCVGMGFGIKDKAVRIYGLVLSLLVCAKIVLYDYSSVSTLQRTILFFCVGVLAIIIAAIYIILEKKQQKD